MNEKLFVETLRKALKERENWTDKAHCIGLWDIFDMDYEGEDAVSYANYLPFMRKICASCPVKEQCLNDTLLYSDEYGFRAGLTAKERRVLRRKANIDITWESKQEVLRRS